jgi:hypothetical protein
LPVAPRGSVARSIAVATINGKGKRKGKDKDNVAASPQSAASA